MTMFCSLFVVSLIWDLPSPHCSYDAASNRYKGRLYYLEMRTEAPPRRLTVWDMQNT